MLEIDRSRIEQNSPFLKLNNVESLKYPSKGPQIGRGRGRILYENVVNDDYNYDGDDGDDEDDEDDNVADDDVEEHDVEDDEVQKQ